MVNKKRGAVIRAGVILLAVILFFTVFSRTINYFLTPKVTIALVRPSAISHELRFSHFEMLYDGAIELRLPSGIDVPVAVTEAFIQKGDTVAAGDPLAVFDGDSLENALRESVLDVLIHKDALHRFDVNFESEKRRLERQIEDDTAALAAANSNSTQAKRLEEDRAQREADLEYMTQNQILNGQIRQSYTAALDAAQERHDILSRTISELRAFTAPKDGYVRETNLRAGQELTGGDLLFTILTDESRPTIRVQMTEAEAANLQPGDAATIEYTTLLNMQRKTSTAETVIANIALTGDMYQTHEITASLRQAIPYDAIVTGVTVKPPANAGIVIPLSAIVNGSSVYVVTERDTFLGKELYVTRRDVTIGDRNASQALVTNGLSENEYIVTSWDRSIHDGQRVVLPNN